ncbi:hypothetical protein [Psychroserpens sp.]|uniref:DUF7935 family protein n=1 Tax=Psychroserpens sp. TaxID=2020870 RepID=UPI001B21360E|nr:hypothetical protein [Psychroserpens sp.]MBO6607457.1 hypothetical protein [Psychroserpens sp.]MBO6631318.1 hypothetical protein [Psychroserpens sp.]MBO6654465.1 hypothetical protein [Psychroserpens sp.]MBO6681186.1 hypothetical protein [Psychroserpens sp.]MBO6749857.1 hypothetical protein [Psychroserpens sp.]
MELEIIGLLLYCIPALVTGAVAFLFFREHVENENRRRDFLIQKDLQKEALPMRLQAYERLSLFLERIKPSKLLLRVSPNGSNKEDYENLLIASIEQEFDHNIAQQIYVTDQCWNITSTAKNATIQMIRKATISEKVDSADKLRESILTDMIDKRSPSDAALSFIKEEVSNIW